jgi:hypothetical protein
MYRKLTALILLLLVSTVYSTPLVIHDTVGGGRRTDFAGTLGLGFVMGPESRVVDSLGFIDLDEDGLINEHPAAIWDSSGTLIAQAVIPAGTDAPLIDGFRYAPIEGGPVRLEEGIKYFLGVLVVSGGDPFTDANPAQLDSYYIGDNTEWHLGWAGGDTLTQTQVTSPGGWADQNLYGSYNMAYLGAKVVKAGLVAPAAEAIVGEVSPTLEWIPGDLAVSHDVYFGTDVTAVAKAMPDSPEYVGNQLESTLSVGTPESLLRGVTYYWRVDEINPAEPNSPWKGDVWSFFVQPLKAYDLWPVDKTEYVTTSAVLKWKKGYNSIGSRIYIGTDAQEVADATGGPVLQETSYQTEAMPNSTTHYWRVDQVDSDLSVVKGDVQSFTTVPVYGINDESLLGWWTLDEPNAGSAVDRSGYALHGTIEGHPVLIDGVLGGAWNLDGSSYAVTPVPVDVNTNTLTFCGWVKPENANAWDGIIFTRSGSNTAGLSINGTKEAAYHWLGAHWDFRSGLHIRNDEWSFVAAVIEPTKATLVVNDTNSVNEGEGVEHPARPLGAGFTLGGDSPGWTDRNFNGSLDDLRVYTRALTLDELQQVMQVAPPTRESNVLVVEDFDGYAAYDLEDLPNVWDIWSDGYAGNGTGSTVGNLDPPYLEISSPVAGPCALPLNYLNNNTALNPDGSFSANFSEIRRVFDPSQDFQRGSAVALTLWIKGAVTNEMEATDKLYMVLSDDSQQATVVLAEADELKKSNWRKITIELAGLGINLNAVTEIALGVGDPNNPQIGGFGVVFIDEIVLSTTLD